MSLKRFIIASALLSLILTGCNQQTTPPTAPQQATQTPPVTNPPTATTPPTVAPNTTQVSGADLYNSKCAGCHGANGTGGSAPALNTDEWKNNSSKVQDITRKGKNGMPGFATSLNDTQIKAIGDYVASLKK